MQRRFELSALSLLVVVALLAACGQPPIHHRPPPPRDGYEHTSVSVGMQHNLVLQDDGTVVAWGRNDYGQLGDGTKEDRSTPVAVMGLTDVISVHSGYYNSYALLADGTVWAWGLNNLGQLGIGTTTEQLTPAQLPGLSDVVQMHASVAHALAVTADGSVFGWGANFAGQLADGTAEYRTTPAKAVDLANIVRVFAGTNHTSLALEQDGTMLMWGRHPGFGPVGSSSVPTQVPDVPGIVDFAAGGQIVSNVDVHHVIALDENGEVWLWGNSSYVLQEDGTYEFTPSLVPSFGSVVDVDSNYHGLHLALLADGTAWSWGSGYLGDGETYSSRTTPEQIASLEDIRSVHPGGTHTLVADESGSLWAWGQNSLGQLGDGTTETRYAPVAVTVLQSAP
ncbi:MAG: hypothetical protein KF813_09295 [Trueperaceae bacterium]|nr:hypothetical protein [Trueperaceae bacterium]